MAKAHERLKKQVKSSNTIDPNPYICKLSIQFMEYDEVLDSSGKSCPVPILNLQKFMRTVEVGKIVKVISTDEVCVQNVPIYVRRHKHTLIGSEQIDDKYIFYIRKN